VIDFNLALSQDMPFSATCGPAVRFAAGRSVPLTPSRADPRRVCVHTAALKPPPRPGEPAHGLGWHRTRSEATAHDRRCAAWARPEGRQREATARYSALLEHGRNDVSGVWDDWYTLGLTLLDALGRGTSPGLDLMLMYAAAHSCQ